MPRIRDLDPVAAAGASLVANSSSNEAGLIPTSDFVLATDFDTDIGTAVQDALDLKVTGPGSSTSGRPAVFNGTGGNAISEVTFSAFKTSLALVKGDVGLGNVVNTDTTTQANVVFTGLSAGAAVGDTDTFPTNQGASNLKQTFAAVKTWVKSWIAKGDVGLGNVDNTSDASKPISTLTQAALDVLDAAKTEIDLTNVLVDPSATRTVYVATTGSDAAAGTVGAPLETVTEALDRVAEAGAFGNWTISLAVGHYTHAAIEVSLPNKVTIAGQTATTTASAAVKASGSAGAWVVEFTVASAANIATGDVIVASNVVGTDDKAKIFSGAFKVTNVSGTTVTVAHKTLLTTFPTATLTSADITILRSTLTFTNSGITNYSDLLLDGVALIGANAASSNGLLTAKRGDAKCGKVSTVIKPNSASINFDVGILAQYGSSVEANGAAVAGCTTYNVLSQHGGFIYFNDGITGSAAGVGVAASNGGDISAERAIAIGNGTYGAYAFAGGSILLKSGFSHLNGYVGLRQAYGGAIRCGGTFKARWNGDLAAGAGVTGSGAESVSTGTIYCEGDQISDNNPNNLTASDYGVIEGTGGTFTGATSNIASVTTNALINITNAALDGKQIFANRGGKVLATGTTGTAFTTNIPVNRTHESGSRIDSATRTTQMSRSEFAVGAITSTDATPTAVATYTIPEGTTGIATIKFVAKSGTDSGGGEIKARIKRNVGGSAAIIGTNTTPAAWAGDTSISTAAIAVVNSGNLISARWTGVAATTVDVKASIEYEYMVH